ncbi:MAG: FKBP-type peptidyl-prolyl cis-trans isomerase [Fuerstiella sp.]|nr:FKBP-type peptidyl-prolyl cis-trans isomerase [Fuerstiella sp.]MCP4511321.1 FKBP-type peptidyl-prolyl cis-trans isomerase [Fuerstiella sp.]
MRLLATLIVLTGISAVASAQDKPEPVVELKTAGDKVSYAVGLNIGRNLKQQGLNVDLELLTAGINASLAGTKPAMTNEEIQAAFLEYQAEQTKASKEVIRKFMENNMKTKGMQQTKSGIQYLVLREGSGEKPTKKSTVSTHYRGKLVNGTVFDESYKGNSPTEDERPASFGVTQVIAGWTEALQMMKVGAKYRLFIPPELAYGDRGQSTIPPNSLLIFDIELVGIQ